MGFVVVAVALAGVVSLACGWPHLRRRHAVPRLFDGAALRVEGPFAHLFFLKDQLRWAHRSSDLGLGDMEGDFNVRHAKFAIFQISSRFSLILMTFARISSDFIEKHA